MAVLLTPPYLQFLDADGAPLSGGKIYSYIAGTTTPKPTYTDYTGSTKLTNPIVIDSAGRAVVFIQGSYRFDIKDSADNLIRTIDNVSSFSNGDSSVSAFFDIFSGDGLTTNFTLSSNLGTDEKSIMVFVSQGQQDYIYNGNFDTDTVWSKGTGWTIAAGVATATGAISTALSQTATNTLEVGKAYRVTYTVTRSAGGIIPSIGGNSGTERTASGTYTEIIIAGATQTVAFTGNAFTGTIDTITVKNLDLLGYEIQSPSAYTLNGTSLTFAQAPKSGTNNIYVCAPSTLAGTASAAADAAINAENGALSAQAAAEAAQDAAEAAASAFVGSNVNYIPYANVGGTVDAITLTSVTSITSYTEGMILTFISTGANTGAVTINLNGLGNKSIVKRGSSALSGGDITTGILSIIQYDGTNFQLLSFRTIRNGDIASNQIGTSKLGDDITTAGKSILTAADAAAGRTALGLGTAATANTGVSSGNVPLLGTGGAQICASYNIPNNGVQTLEMPSVDTVVMAIVGCSSSTHGIFIARMGTTPFVSGTTNFAGTTGVLNGSTGTAGKLTLSTSGTTLYIENRQGFTYVVSILLSHNNA